MARRKQHRKKSLSTKKLTWVEREKRKKLSQLADRQLDRLEQLDELSKLAKNNSVQGKRIQDTVGNLIDNVSAEYLNNSLNDSAEAIDKFRAKLKILKDLIIDNISLSKPLNNFDTDEYRKDKKKVNDIIFKLESTSVLYVEDKKLMNEIYKVHKKINAILNPVS
tara:strand:- start:232 stop:726 length:495 start_codon:yes stop_codon:yes gene_type:complete